MIKVISWSIKTVEVGHKCVQLKELMSLPKKNVVCPMFMARRYKEIP